MRFVIAVALFAACAAALGMEADPYWVMYKEQFGKVYSSEAVEAVRYEAFLRNMADAARFNAIDKTARYGWTERSDRPLSELLAPLPVPSRIVRTAVDVSNDDIPKSFDWRDQKSGGVTRVKDQGQCGSCWAFCAVATMETAYFIKHGKLLDLSESQVVDCDERDSGCNGGWPTTAMEWIRDHGGIMLESDYPYKPVKQTCNFVPARAVMMPTNIQTLKAHDATAMQVAIMKRGLLTIAIDASKFNSYSNGIMDGNGCRQGGPNHGIAIVGWGVEKDVTFWIVKNSWGKGWGEKGYVRVILGKNACGIEDYPMICDAE